MSKTSSFTPSDRSKRFRLSIDDGSPFNLDNILGKPEYEVLQDSITGEKINNTRLSDFTGIRSSFNDLSHGMARGLNSSIRGANRFLFVKSTLEEMVREEILPPEERFIASKVKGKTLGIENIVAWDKEDSLGGYDLQSEWEVKNSNLAPFKNKTYPASGLTFGKLMRMREFRKKINGKNSHSSIDNMIELNQDNKSPFNPISNEVGRSRMGDSNTFSRAYKQSSNSNFLNSETTFLNHSQSGLATLVNKSVLHNQDRLLKEESITNKAINTNNFKKNNFTYENMKELTKLMQQFLTNLDDLEEEDLTFMQSSFGKEKKKDTHINQNKIDKGCFLSKESGGYIENDVEISIKTLNKNSPIFSDLGFSASKAQLMEEEEMLSERLYRILNRLRELSRQNFPKPNGGRTLTLKQRKDLYNILNLTYKNQSIKFNQVKNSQESKVMLDNHLDNDEYDKEFDSFNYTIGEPLDLKTIKLDEGINLKQLKKEPLIYYNIGKVDEDFNFNKLKSPPIRWEYELDNVQSEVNKSYNYNSASSQHILAPIPKRNYQLKPGLLGYMTEHDFEEIKVYYNAKARGAKEIKLSFNFDVERTEKAIRAHHIFDHLPKPSIDFEPLPFRGKYDLYKELYYRYMFMEEDDFFANSNFITKQRIDENMFYLISKVIGIILASFCECNEDRFYCYTLVYSALSASPEIELYDILNFVVAAILASLKMISVNLPRIVDMAGYVKKVGGSIDIDQIKSSEADVFKALQFNLDVVNPARFIWRMNQIYNNNTEIYYLALFFLEITQYTISLVTLKPSHAAAACFALAIRIYGEYHWNAIHHYYSGYSFEELDKPIQDLIKSVKNFDEDHFVYKIYSHPKCKEVAKIYENYRHRAFTNEQLIQSVILRGATDRDCALKKIKKIPK